MPHYQDPDPTPPHGTPRPLSIHWYTSKDETFTVTLVYSSDRQGWEVHTRDSVTGELVVYPPADGCPAFADEHHARSLASYTVLTFEAGVSNALSLVGGVARPVSASLAVPSYSFHDEDVLNALDMVEDACVTAREWLTQTLEAIRLERYSPESALADSAALQFPETSVFHAVRVALGALASFTDKDCHPFGSALDR